MDDTEETWRPGLLGIIERYDQEQSAYIAQLKAEVRTLKREKADLVAQLVSSVQTSDRMKLDLIMSGALRRPESTDTQP